MKHAKMLSAIIALMRWDKPAGGGLVIWTCWWGVLAGSIVASKSIPWNVLLTLGLCAFLLRSAGCIVNDIIDRSLDRSVKRTSLRPLASGALNLSTALVLLFVLCVCALFLGWLVLGWHLALWLALLSFPLFLLYPYAKYLTPCPQVFLGMIFNWSLVVGFVSVSPSWLLSPTLWLLFLGAVFWTVGYDTIYACQDRKDDLLAGVASLALAQRWDIKMIVSFCYGMSFVSISTAFILLNPTTTSIVLLCLVGWHLLFQLLAFKIEDSNMCWSLFCSNNIVGMLIVLGLLGQIHESFLL